MIQPGLLETVVCPITRELLRHLTHTERETLDGKLRSGSLCFIDGSLVEEQIGDALISSDSGMVYIVHNGIPLLYPDRAIPLEQ